MGAPSIDMKDVLVAAGVGTFAAASGWGIYVSEEPTANEASDTVVTVYDTGALDVNPKWLLDHVQVQVRIRGAKDDYVATYAKAQAVMDALLGLPAQTINSTPYVGVWAEGGINHLGGDDNGRPIFTTNFRILREPASGTNRTAI